ncbi:hypothetical protein [Natrialbaceae archaeon AArc-T1-2]|uniref:hypothetical protein n=1 Tax=Natrialbaceae archaeon AArc-T1-2 TaxID=3053904 RepID=UPI00255A8782|nr:hypothetical protein [Natrialbaceae archaeon AArc-T1-2]WIV66954.1 hypothetical protein QQ977_14890 [Natrialbaceae archaeon AArc-T1-2]
MTLRVDERATDVREIDRFEGGVGWIAHPEETIQRASHALAVDDEVWVIDPVDADGLDELLAEFGEVAGVVVTFDRHTRDAATVANRHGVSVYLPSFFENVAEGIDAPITRFGAELDETGFEVHVLQNNRFWQEIALYDPDERTLVVPESVGTAAYFLARGERLGVHPMLRGFPPRDLAGFDPDRVLVGHGEGVFAAASSALRSAIDGSRRRMPALYAKTLRTFLPV